MASTDIVFESQFNICKQGRYGYILYNKHDKTIGPSFHLYGEWAQYEMDLLKVFIKPGHWILDVGANIGAHTLFFSRAAGDSGRVHAFEPLPGVFHNLCAALSLNSLQNVRAYHAAVGKDSGHILVPRFDYSQGRDYGGVHLGGFTSGDEVPLMRIDDLQLPRCDLIKIDVEGMDLSVLQGAERTIDTFRPILYVENNDARKSKAMIAHLLQKNYCPFWHFAPFYNRDNYYQNSENVFEGLVDGNMICVDPKQAEALVSLPRVEGIEDTAEKALQRIP